MTRPAPPPPSEPAAPVPYFFADGACTPAIADVLNRFLAAIPLLAANRTEGVAHARQVLRTAGLSWPAVLNHRGDAYGGRLVAYGHAEVAARDAQLHTGAEPPAGRLPDGTWRPGWVGTCARHVAARVAWAPVPVLVEMALLAASSFPIPAEVERADALMRAVWVEPAAPFPED